MNTDRDPIYEHELEKHIDRMIRILEEYRITMDEWSEKDFLGIERAFQILAEAMIGLCRYVVSQCYGLNVSRSREAADELRKLNVFSRAEHSELMTIFIKTGIGFRNVLVHDYLNVNEDILRSLIRERKYLFIAQMRDKLLQIAEQSSGE